MLCYAKAVPLWDLAPLRLCREYVCKYQCYPNLVMTLTGSLVLPRHPHLPFATMQNKQQSWLQHSYLRCQRSHKTTYFHPLWQAWGQKNLSSGHKGPSLFSTAIPFNFRYKLYQLSGKKAWENKEGDILKGRLVLNSSKVLAKLR